ncbi:MAG: YraN family protein [Bacteroidales bacterium]|nr:YraN family protein [Bacteroidales bacterium]
MPSQAKSLGNWGETLAVEYLIGQGYAILERNWKMGHLEVDIIAMKDNIIAFVEVKTRGAIEYDPVSAVDRKKRKRTITSADAYLKMNRLPYDFRFDIISVSGGPDGFKLEHLPDAYFPSLKSHNYTFRL